ncbi:CRISPR-associated endonuclease Cas3'' [Desulfurobacterium sp.]
MDGIIFYSHREPFIKLRNHLSDVANRCLQIYENQKEFVKLPINEDFIEIVALAHDFGKYTTYFQEYIKNKKRDPKNRHYHGFISALFGAWLAENRDYLPLIAYFVIRHHHGDLKNFDEDLDNNQNALNFEILKQQLEDIKKNQKYVEKELGFSISDFLENYRQVWKNLKKLKFELFEGSEEKRIEVYFNILYTYSLLIDSDKKSAGKVESIRRKELPENLLEIYRRKKGWSNPETEIDKLRNQIYEEIKNKIKSFNTLPPISTITAPTGLGKTFLNLEVALQYRRNLNNKSRIIYSLPFVSIIDQTYKIYDEILTGTLGEEYTKNKSLYLLKHHHLSDTKYKKENEDKPVSESLLLIESWDSEIIITTFVQFLHSVIAFKNSFIKKFHNIVGSIIILDEVQAIDTGLWKVIGKVLKKLTELFRCKIILSTATKPLIVEDYTELVENKKYYFSHPFLKRTKLLPKIEKEKTLEEFANYFLQNIDHSINSYLVVLNTIKSSIEFFEKIYNVLNKEYKICYLSTNFIYQHNSCSKKGKNRKNKKTP